MTNTIWKISTVLSIIGIILASYLLFNFVTANSFDLCTVNAQVNCKAVTTGEISTIFGIPVSLVGLLGYITILIASRLKNKAMFLGMSAFGVLFCLRLTILELFVIRIICPVCLICQTIMLILFLLSIFLFFLKEESISQTK
jgi:uncharacterized membrane protein